MARVIADCSICGNTAINELCEDCQTAGGRWQKYQPCYAGKNKHLTFKEKQKMAHFRSTIVGNRGQSSRLGSRVGGMNATICGWNVGASIRICHENGEDVIYISATGGSNGACPSRAIATIRKIDGELVVDAN